MTTPLSTHQLDDGAIRITATRDGLSVSTTVSSWHLVEDKRGQLEIAINRLTIQPSTGAHPER